MSLLARPGDCFALRCEGAEHAVGVIFNGAKAHNYGIDNSIELSITPDLLLTGGVVYLHDRFTQFPNAILAVENANGTTSTVVGSAKGNRLPFAPDVTANIGLDYKRNIFGGKADLFVNDLYNSGYYGQSDNFLHQGSFNMLSASLQFQPDNFPVSLKIYARNMLNVRVAEYLSVASTGAIESIEPPRTYGFTVGVKF